MIESSRQSLVCPIMIGREAELATVRAHLARADGRVLLVSGEAGIGKSRLATEAKAHAATLGFRVLQGGCFESDRSVPYAPFLDMLQAPLAGGQGAEILRAMGPLSGELAKLFPELAASLDGTARGPAIDPELERRRLFQALSDLFARLARAAPLLVVVEDLHWADETSLELLVYLARHAREQRILFLLTYRTEEVMGSLAHFLAGLDRQRLASEVTLGRLSSDEVHRMLRATLQQASPVPAEVLHAIDGLTEGNPFFIEEVLKSLAMAGDLSSGHGVWDLQAVAGLRIPRSVQDAVRRRSAQLSPEAREVLALAAVIGQRFGFALLCELTGYDERTLLPWVKELIAAHLVVEESAERLVFRHALTRQAVYTDLLERERQALHLRTAAAVERLHAGGLDGYTPDLAYHYYAAGAWAQALEYCRRAGEQARRHYTPRIAVEHFTRALEATHQLGTPPPRELYRDRGAAYGMLGEFDKALADHEAVLETARSSRDRRAEWEALLDLGMLWAGRDYGRTGELYQRALEVARGMGDPHILAQSLNRRGNWLLNSRQSVEALEDHREALRVSQELGDQNGVAQTLDMLGMTSYFFGELVQGAEYYRRAASLFRELGDQQGSVSALSTLMLFGGSYQSDTVAPATMTLVEVRHLGGETRRVARAINWRAAEAYALFTLGLCLGTRGEYADALTAALESLAIAEEIEHRQWTTAAHCAAGAVYRDLLVLTEARRHFEQALVLAQQTGSQWWVQNVSGFLAATYVLQRDLARAETVVDLAIGADAPALTLGQRLCWSARTGLALARGDPEQALRIVDLLIDSVPRGGSQGPFVVPYLARLRGEALTALGRVQAAETVLEEAREAAAVLGARPLLWRIHASLGNLHRGQGRHDEAERKFAAARGIIEELAKNLPSEVPGAMGPIPLRDEFLRQTSRLLPHPRTASARQAAKRQFGGLTEREREVAGLVAQGRSNREIAADLFVGERTVETHVTNILVKLGFTSRVQIAAWATEKGLPPKR